MNCKILCFNCKTLRKYAANFIIYGMVKVRMKKSREMQYLPAFVFHSVFKLFRVLIFCSESLDNLIDSVDDFDEVFFLISSGSHRRGTDSHAGGFLRSTLFARHAVFVERDADLVAFLLQDSAAEWFIGEVQQDQMVICAAGYNLVAETDELIG